MGRHTHERARERIARAASQGLDLPTFWREAAPAIASAVPHHLSPCWFTLDPASLLATSHYDHGVIPELPREWLAHEYYGDDVHKLADVATSSSGISTLHDATNGDPSKSQRWNLFVRPFGGEQELLVALRTRGREAWGILALYREPGQRTFDLDELTFIRSVAPLLAEGARRGLLIADAAEARSPDGPGLVVLRDNWTLESFTPAADRWLSELAGADRSLADEVPAPVLAVAGQALRAADGRSLLGDSATARVRTATGQWLVLHGAPLVVNGTRRSAVIVEPTEPGRISSLVMAAYGLTTREREVTRLVLRGWSTQEIADTLRIAAGTVQQHLKSIFDKTGVRSRRELVGSVFFAHYEPRLRDNERRAVVGQPLRGRPMAAEPGVDLPRSRVQPLRERCTRRPSRRAR